MGGFYGVVSHDDCVMDVYFGTDYHSHLGTSRGGLAIWSGKSFNRSIHNIENTQFRAKFEAELPKIKGNMGIGCISDTDPQPLTVRSHLGQYAISTVGKINNLDEIVEKTFINRHIHFLETSRGTINPTELVSVIIDQQETFKEGLLKVQEMIQGSCSVMLLTPEGIYASRDRVGRTPMIVGRKKRARCVSFESCMFANLGYKPEYELGPGEIVFVSPDGIEKISPPRTEMKICAFLWVYYGYPTSYYEGINVDECRGRCGAALARRDEVNADFVCGIPDSGVGHAVGYSNEKMIPYKRAYSKYTPTWPRSFMPQNQGQRDLVAKMKLIPNRAVIEGKKMIFIDDSIVRGTQLKDNTIDLRKSGADEVHMRIACPPLLYPCEFLNFSQSRTPMELAGRKAIYKIEGDIEDIRDYSNPDTEKYKKMVDTIAATLDLDSLVYQRLDDLVEAIGLPKEKLCTHCWDGTGYIERG